MNSDQPADDVGPDLAPPTADIDAEAIAACMDLDAQDATMLRLFPSVIATLRELAETYNHERVEWAADCGLIAIAERIGRICRRDLPASQL
jgi:hypothetical protein